MLVESQHLAELGALGKLLRSAVNCGLQQRQIGPEPTNERSRDFPPLRTPDV